tara:strand:+ start:369 stop:743 length:375 start_codon:yes stop_codon:yes gene_type:complete
MIIKKDYSFLPGIIIEIANIIDMEYAVKIAALANAKQKNISVYFPEKVKREHVLSMVLPFEKVQQLASHYKGETIIIPQTKKVSNILKSKKIKHLYSIGYPISKITSALKVSKTTVYKYIGEAN